jgi:hypothetical protein
MQTMVRRNKAFLFAFLTACGPTGGQITDNQRSSGSSSDARPPAAAHSTEPDDAPSESGAPSGSDSEELPPLCDTFEALVIDHTKQNSDYVDCGVVDHKSSKEQWQAAHDCVKRSNENRTPFSVIFSRHGTDSILGAAYIGVAGPSFRVDQITWDSDPCGGAGCGPEAKFQSPCTLRLEENCVPGARSMPCMKCAESWQSAKALCGPKF